MMVSSEPVSRTKSWALLPLMRARTTTLSLTRRNGSVCRTARSASIDLDQADALERVEELHLGARPGGLVAAILVRQQVDIAAQRGGGIVVAIQALIQLAEQGVDLAVARRGRRCGESDVERFIQLAERRQ